MPQSVGRGESREIRRVIVGGATLNLALAVAKAIVGVFGGSIALVADAIHSLSDLFTDAVAALGTRLGTMPPDRSHPYGHGKIETISALTIGSLLMAVGAGISWEAGAQLYNREHSAPGIAVLIAAAVSIIAKEFLYVVTKRVAIRYDSSVLYANAWHHRSDSLSSVAVVVGTGVSMLGWGHGDQIAGLAVGFMIIAVGGKVAWDAMYELAEGSIPPEATAALERTLSAHPDVRGWHRLRSRRAGREVFIDVHVLVDPSLNVLDGHEISDRVAEALRASLARPANILVHIEPDTERFRDTDPGSAHDRRETR